MFSVPKPFSGRIRTIQENAIRSWKLIDDAIDVLLFGDEEGVAEVAGQFNVRHVPRVLVNEFGTPLVSSVFEQAQSLSKRPYLCFVNSDIILRRDFLAAAQCIPFQNFLMVGRRWDLEVAEKVDLSDPSHNERFRQHLSNEGKLHPATGSDYFLFPRNILWQMPPFAVGRPIWDNWLLYRARAIGLPVVDASAAATVVHQNHDYSHIPLGADITSWNGPEAERNRELGANTERIYTLFDASHILLPNMFEKVWGRPFFCVRSHRRLMELASSISAKVRRVGS